MVEGVLELALYSGLPARAARLDTSDSAMILTSIICFCSTRTRAEGVCFFQLHYGTWSVHVKLTLDRRVQSSAVCLSSRYRAALGRCNVSYERRTRFWESAERTSRHGDVDGVAIITLVSP